MYFVYQSIIIPSNEHKFLLVLCLAKGIKSMRRRAWIKLSAGLLNERMERQKNYNEPGRGFYRPIMRRVFVFINMEL